jgi:phosphatidylserine/phosphatidylglycerophosphate/cardiolipin synthase-like enzyme
MTLIVQPDSGVGPVLTAIRKASKSIDIMIFRLDIQDLRKALAGAVARGVTVRALIAHTNRGGEKTLRKLEQQLLEAGVTVSRTADDFLRYHGKMMLIDDKALHVYGFNFTWLDIERSRSFGIVTRHKRLVQEAKKLFEADAARQPYSAGFDRFVVSPENARARLTALIKGARKQLLIYDPKISDPGMLRLLKERARAGVEIRVIGRVTGKPAGIANEKYPGKRLHVRVVLQDGRRLFMGSQSLRKLELDHRREVGVIIDDKKAVAELARAFEADWALTAAGKAAVAEIESAAGSAEKEKELEAVGVSA